MATTAIQPRNATVLPAPILHEITAIMGNVPALLPPDIPFEQFRAGLWLEFQQQEHMGECAPPSIVASVIKAANAGLLPGRDCHVIPFKNHGRYEATLVANYAGIILAMERSGKVRKAFAHAVYSHDHFEVDYLEDRFSHKPHLTSQRGDLVCFYGCVLLKDGSRHLEVMTLEQIDVIRRKAPRHDTGPWATHYEEMARKTALKRVAKYVRLAPQQQQLLDDDDDRERSDISQERFQQTAADLYGEPRAIPNFAPPVPIETKIPPTPGSDTSQEKNAANRHEGSNTEHASAFRAPPQTELHGVEADDIPPQVTGGQVYIEQLTALMEAHGEPPDAIQAFWHKACQNYKVSSPVAIPRHALPKMLSNWRAHYEKQDREDAQASVAQPVAATLRAETLPRDEPGAWRNALADAALMVPESAEALHQEIAAALMSTDTPEGVGQALLARVQAVDLSGLLAEEA